MRRFFTKKTEFSTKYNPVSPFWARITAALAEKALAWHGGCIVPLFISEAEGALAHCLKNNAHGRKFPHPVICKSYKSGKKNLSIYVSFVFVLPKYLYTHFDDGVLA